MNKPIGEWKKKYGMCDKCHTENNSLFPSFGKWICKSCKDLRPHKGKGNSGLNNSGQGMFVFPSEHTGIHLERVKKSNPVFGKLFFEHYPKSKGIPGRSLCYLVFDRNELVAIIGFNSPPRNYKLFRSFFSCDNDNVFLINNVFRIIVSAKNRGTKILHCARRQVREDYLQRFGVSLLGLVTFVEPPRSGSVYKADNWIYLGESQGIQMRRDKKSWERVYSAGTRKHIFAYKY